jgi:hypothetical protein
MRIDLEDERRSVGEPPPGIEIRGVDPARDVAAVHGILSEAFVDEWRYRPTLLSEWMAEETASASYDPRSGSWRWRAMCRSARSRRGTGAAGAG